MSKKILAGLLSAFLLVNAVNVPEVGAMETDGVLSLEEAGAQSALPAAEGQDGFGNLLADVVNEEALRQQENNGCNIFSIAIEGTQAAVSLETTKRAAVIVAVYDEAGNAMLASGRTMVEAGDTEAAVEIDLGEMPSYFYLRGFLVDENSFRPISDVYASANYTL